MYIILSTKIMLTLIVCTYSLVFIGNMVWNYNLERMPWSFKFPLAFIAFSMLVSIFNFVIAVIWGLV